MRVTKRGGEREQRIRTGKKRFTRGRLEVESEFVFLHHVGGFIELFSNWRKRGKGEGGNPRSPHHRKETKDLGSLS